MELWSIAEKYGKGKKHKVSFIEQNMEVKTKWPLYIIAIDIDREVFFFFYRMHSDMYLREINSRVLWVIWGSITGLQLKEVLLVNVLGYYFFLEF